MNKSELIYKIARDAEVTKAVAAKAFDAMIAGVSESLKKGEAVTLIGFGTFSVSKRAARAGRNPQTGKAIEIAAKNVVKFKPGKGLSESV